LLFDPPDPVPPLLAHGRKKETVAKDLGSGGDGDDDGDVLVVQLSRGDGGFLLLPRSCLGSARAIANLQTLPTPPRGRRGNAHGGVPGS
jgi:hypothetical protein